MVEEPILTNLETSKNGTITFYGNNIKGDTLEHIFSFTYYLPEGRIFEGSPYAQGLRVYAKLVKEKNWGMIIYTDKYTLPILEQAFPFDSNPNLTLAIVSWPYFSDEKGNVDNAVMRTLRYHAIEHFKDKNVHMRDADTLFPVLLKKYVKDQYKEYNFEKIVSSWEETYIEAIPDIREASDGKEKQIIMGTNYEYRSAFFHRNLVYPLEFTFPYRVNTNMVSGKKKNTNVFLYVKGNDFTSENKEKAGKYYQNIAYKSKIFHIPQFDQESNEDFLKRAHLLLDDYLKKGNIQTDFTIQNKQIEFKILSKEQEIKMNIGNKLSNQYKATVPADRREIVPFFLYFQKKYMFLPENAVFAGFVSVLENRQGIEDFWGKCVDYLLQRYHMTTNQGKVVTTNELFKTVPKDNPYYTIGKDERMLLYSIIPNYIDVIFFFEIIYDADNIDRPQYKSFMKGNLFNNLLEHHEEFLEYFTEFIKDYNEWYAEFMKKYPNKESFYNALNKNLEERLISKNKLNKPKTNKNSYKVLPYNAYEKVGRKATRRVKGGKSKTLKKRH